MTPYELLLEQLAKDEDEQVFGAAVAFLIAVALMVGVKVVTGVGA